MAIEEDQNGVFWSLLVDLYTEETRFKAESELYYESRTLVTYPRNQSSTGTCDIRDNRNKRHISATSDKQLRATNSP
jgi:hypothetical protein